MTSRTIEYARLLGDRDRLRIENNRMRAALGVIAGDLKIAEWLSLNDPQALLQVKEALGDKPPGLAVVVSDASEKDGGGATLRCAEHGTDIVNHVCRLCRQCPNCRRQIPEGYNVGMCMFGQHPKEGA